MKRISLAEFRRRCLEVVDIIAATCEPVVITKNGKPIAKLVPAGRPMQDFFGCLAGTIEVAGDIESPLQPAEDWEALR